MLSRRGCHQNMSLVQRSSVCHELHATGKIFLVLLLPNQTLLTISSYCKQKEFCSIWNWLCRLTTQWWKLHPGMILCPQVYQWEVTHATTVASCWKYRQDLSWCTKSQTLECTDRFDDPTQEMQRRAAINQVVGLQSRKLTLLKLYTVVSKAYSKFALEIGWHSDHMLTSVAFIN